MPHVSQQNSKQKTSVLTVNKRHPSTSSFTQPRNSAINHISSSRDTVAQNMIQATLIFRKDKLYPTHHHTTQPCSKHHRQRHLPPSILLLIHIPPHSPISAIHSPNAPPKNTRKKATHAQLFQNIESHPIAYIHIRAMPGEQGSQVDGRPGG